MNFSCHLVATFVKILDTGRYFAFLAQSCGHEVVKRLVLSKDVLMSHWKLFIVAACLSLCLAESASADPWGRYNRGYYRPYAAPVYVRPPVIVPRPLPPRVIVTPGYAYPPQVYSAPPVMLGPAVIVGPPVIATSGPVYGPPIYGPAAYGPPAYGPAVYGPPAYGYGVVSPRGRVHMGYSGPGIGIYLGR